MTERRRYAPRKMSPRPASFDTGVKETKLAAEQHSATFPKGKRPLQLAICRACHQFVHSAEIECPFCGTDLLEAAIAYNVQLIETKQMSSELEELLKAFAPVVVQTETD